MSDIVFSEDIRLVIWDLDETLWSGTLTEGEIEIPPSAIEIIKELSKRGIVNSICSKNDFESVKPVLENFGLWEYFIFPSINWKAKGPRIASLIETIQLRPESVLFIDDNLYNLNEATHYAPGIQVAGVDFISGILQNSQFLGKSDPDLSRLNHYKVMEKRKADTVASGNDTSSFLKSSNIVVDLIQDLDKHLDRIIELINRTNQLNFTKSRLPENIDDARTSLSEFLSRYDIQAALINVRDKYGDHGIVGFYAINSQRRELLHFCFSCRILGMGVEHWLYNRLGRPLLYVTGEVQSDPTDDSLTIDWINQQNFEGDTPSSKVIYPGAIYAHGGCDLSATMHYFGVEGANVAAQFNEVRNNVNYRIDHSIFLEYALHGITEQQLEAATQLGYHPDDFVSSIFTKASDFAAVIFSFSTDAHHALYRHRETGLIVPFWLGRGVPFNDQRLLETNDGSNTGEHERVHRLLRENYEFIGLPTESIYKNRIAAIMDRLKDHQNIFVIQSSDYHINNNGNRHPDEKFTNLNRWTREVVETMPNVHLVEIEKMAIDPTDRINILHYNRIVYFRLYNHIRDLLGISKS